MLVSEQVVDGVLERRFQAEFPPKTQFLFKPKRIKVIKGGRGKGASWNIARALLIKGVTQPLLILCAREIQKSIEDSVYRLLVNQIALLGLSDKYQVFDTYIKGSNGTEFIFHGLRHNIDNIKSAEGVDICWVSEARTASKDTWAKLIPTIRKEGSEIWIDYNPELDDDETHMRFGVNPPPNAEVVHMTWRDNPWFPEVLREEMEILKAADYDEYLHVYEGNCKQALEGAVFKDELRKVVSEGRICRVPYDPAKGVHVFVDLGWGDNTSLWFGQPVALEWRFLKTYQNRLKLWPHYLAVIQEAGYNIDTIWLPHDAASGNVRGKSIDVQTREAGKKCRVGKRVETKTIAINAAKTVLPFCWFDEVGCADGLQALRRYVWEKTESGMSTSQPKHDENSHYADGFMEFATGFKDVSPVEQAAAKTLTKLRKEIRLDLPMQSGGWMA